jgi:GST-like protein
VINRRLEDKQFIGGSTYSIVDIAMFPWLRTWDELGLTIDTYPHVRRWLAAIEARPAVQRGLIASLPRVHSSADRDTALRDVAGMP